MSTVLTAIVGPNSYNLTDGTYSWRVMDDNLASPPVRRLEERGPLQHGVTDVGFRLDPRVFTLTLVLVGDTMSALNTLRKNLINIFKPLSSTPIKLNYALDNGDVRQIDCYLAGSLNMGGQGLNGYYSQTVAVQLKAPDPTFYDPTGVSINYGITTSGGTGSIPMAIPQIVGSPTVNQTTAISYTGTWPVNPTIIIKGPLTNPVITNLTTNEKLDLTGAVLISSDTYTIDTRYGYKTIKDQAGVNKISLLSSDSNLATFHLDVDPVAPSGINNIKVVGSAAGASTQVYLQFNTRYIGL